MVSVFKIAWHREKLEHYLRGEPIFPVTLELNLTAACNRSCPDCPSSLGDARLLLDIDFVDRVFSSLQGHTKGLIVTGGEPTLSPVFSQVLEMARQKYGFVDIAVVTNGSCLDDENVVSSIVSFASAVRISLYDWDATSFDGLSPTLRKIEALRKRINVSDRALEIGVSALTTMAKIPVLEELTDLVYGSGAHWIYFHPTCIIDITGARSRSDQQAVFKAIGECRSKVRNGFEVYALEERYEPFDIAFDGYHTAHFALVIGADGKNYLATEVKYQPQYVLSDLVENRHNDFLWLEARLEQIRSVSSIDYPAQGSRNRGVLYNTLIEKLESGNLKLAEVLNAQPADGFRLPHII